MSIARASRLIIVCGLPGAGKTTLAKKLERRLGAIRLCPDEWMEELGIDLWNESSRSKVESLQWKLGQQLLILGHTIVIEWGTWGRSERDGLRTGARALGAAVELHYVSEQIDVLLERMRHRASENSPITREQMQRWADAFDAPGAEEIALYDSPSDEVI